MDAINYIYVIVDNTDGDMRHVAYCTTLDKARKVRETYCEVVLYIDSESEDGDYIFIKRQSVNCFVGADCLICF